MDKPCLDTLQNEITTSMTTELSSALLDKSLIPAQGVANIARILEVHRNGYILRLTDALGETYEAIWRVLGDECFFDACRKYIACNSSPFYNLSDYGENFPAFLRELYLELPFLADLARFEWAFKNLFHTAQHTSIAAIAGGDDEDLVIQFGEGVKLLATAFPVYDLWKHRNDESYDADMPERCDELMVLYKKDKAIWVKRFAETEFRVLEHLAKGVPLHATLAKFEDQLTAENVGELFSFLMEEGLVSGLVPVPLSNSES